MMRGSELETTRMRTMMMNVTERNGDLIVRVWKWMRMNLLQPKVSDLS